MLKPVAFALLIVAVPIDKHFFVIYVVFTINVVFVHLGIERIGIDLPRLLPIGIIFTRVQPIADFVVIIICLIDPTKGSVLARRECQDRGMPNKALTRRRISNLALAVPSQNKPARSHDELTFARMAPARLVDP